MYPGTAQVPSSLVPGLAEGFIERSNRRRLTTSLSLRTAVRKINTSVALVRRSQLEPETIFSYPVVNGFSTAPLTPSLFSQYPAERLICRSHDYPRSDRIVASAPTTSRFRLGPAERIIDRRNRTRSTNPLDRRTLLGMRGNSANPIRRTQNVELSSSHPLPNISSGTATNASPFRIGPAERPIYRGNRRRSSPSQVLNAVLGFGSINTALERLSQTTSPTFRGCTVLPRPLTTLPIHQGPTEAGLGSPSLELSWTQPQESLAPRVAYTSFTPPSTPPPIRPRRRRRNSYLIPPPQPLTPQPNPPQEQSSSPPMTPEFPMITITGLFPSTPPNQSVTSRQTPLNPPPQPLTSPPQDEGLNPPPVASYPEVTITGPFPSVSPNSTTPSPTTQHNPPSQLLTALSGTMETVISEVAASLNPQHDPPSPRTPSPNPCTPLPGPPLTPPLRWVAEPELSPALNLPPQPTRLGRTRRRNARRSSQRSRRHVTLIVPEVVFVSGPSLQHIPVVYDNYMLITPRAARRFLRALLPRRES